MGKGVISPEKGSHGEAGKVNAQSFVIYERK